MKDLLLTVVAVSACAIANADVSPCDNYISKDVLSQRWRNLEEIATNYVDIASASNKMSKLAHRHYTNEDAIMLRKWFCDVISFSMPTNDADLYVPWLKSKTTLIRNAISTQNTNASLDAWHLLAEFLADMKAKRGEGNSDQFLKAHRKAWLANHRLETMEDWGEWRKAYYQAKRYHAAWSWAIIDTERAIEHLAMDLQPSLRKTLGDIIIQKTSKRPDWYIEDQKNTAK